MENAPGFPGVPALVGVSITSATNVVAAQFDLSYATDRATSTAGTAPAFASRQFVRSRMIAPGVRRVVSYSLSKPLSTNRAVIASIPFTPAPAVRDSIGPIIPSNVLLARNDSAALSPLTLESGTVFVRPVFLNEEGIAQFFLPVEPDERYLIQATTDFLRWVPISTNVAISSYLDLVDVDAPLYPRRFYRAAALDALGTLQAYPLSDNSEFVFEITGRPGRQYTVEASTNLFHWEAIELVTLATPALAITNALSPDLPTRFFRLRSDP